MLARDVVVRRAFEILAVAVIDKILVSWLACGSQGLQITFVKYESIPKVTSSKVVRRNTKKISGKLVIKLTAEKNQTVNKLKTVVRYNPRVEILLVPRRLVSRPARTFPRALLGTPERARGRPWVTPRRRRPAATRRCGETPTRAWRPFVSPLVPFFVSPPWPTPRAVR
jgi:hypothetical protein